MIIDVGPIYGGPFAFSYDGEYSFEGDAKGDWKLKFLTSGTLIILSLGNARKGIDILCVGGGGPGAGGAYPGQGGGGGNGGEVLESLGVLVSKGAYAITVGAGGSSGNQGGTTRAFGLNAAGGSPGNGAWGNTPGPVGQGKGGVGDTITIGTQTDYWYVSAYVRDATAGGDGLDKWELGTKYGAGGGGANSGATGPSGEIVSGKGAKPGGANGGGAGGNWNANGADGSANTGAGGGGGGPSKSGGAGGSGIVIIRNKRG